MNTDRESPNHYYRRFDDPLMLAAAVGGSNGLYSALGRGTFAAELTSVSVGRIALQRGVEFLPRVGYIPFTNQVRLLGWPGDAQLPVVRGREIIRGEWVALSTGIESYHRTFGPNDFVSLALEVDDLRRIAIDMIGQEITVSGMEVIHPPAELTAWLMTLVDDVTRLARARPEIFSSPLAAAAMEQAFLQPIIMCLAQGKRSRETITRRQRGAIMKKVEAAVESNPDRPLLVRELCQMTAISERLLRAVFEEQLWLSPHRYLTLRRMNMARKALLRADQYSTTVTEIAMDHGFWELGRFAGIYKSLFGETPSATLRRPVNL